jgi:O-antigen/teichoic acid export membrane protein
MSGRPYITMLNNLAVTFLNIGLGVALIPRYGMTGAAISTAVSLAVLNLVCLVEVRAIFGLFPFRRDTVAMFGSAVFAVVATLPVAFFPSWPTPLAQVAVAGSILFLAYGLAMRAVGLSHEDRELFAVGRARLARRMHLRRS